MTSESEKNAARSAKTAEVASAVARYYAELCGSLPQAVYADLATGLRNTNNKELFYALHNNAVGLFTNNNGAGVWVMDQVTSAQLTVAMSQFNDVKAEADQAIASSQAAALSAQTSAQNVIQATQAAVQAQQGVSAAQSAASAASSSALAAAASAASAVLGASGVLAGSYGSSTQIPVITVDARGIVTSLSFATVGYPTVFEFPLMIDPSPKSGVVLAYFSSTTNRFTLMYPNGTKTELGGG